MDNYYWIPREDRNWGIKKEISNSGSGTKVALINLVKVISRAKYAFLMTGNESSEIYNAKVDLFKGKLAILDIADVRDT